jgi:hypothetical protein
MGGFYNPRRATEPSHPLAQKVIFGPFVGKTKAELLVMLEAQQAKLANGGGAVTGASVGGQSVSKTPGLSPVEMIRLITQALAQVDPDYIAPSGTIYGRFTDPSLCGG